VVIQLQCRVQDFLFVLGSPDTISLKALTFNTDLYIRHAVSPLNRPTTYIYVANSVSKFG